MLKLYKNIATILFTFLILYLTCAYFYTRGVQQGYYRGFLDGEMFRFNKELEKIERRKKEEMEKGTVTMKTENTKSLNYLVLEIVNEIKKQGLPVETALTNVPQKQGIVLRGRDLRYVKNLVMLNV